MFFQDKSFDFETIRALNYYNDHGAEIGEISQIVKRVKEGDFESWYQGWYDMAKKVATLANQSLTGDHVVSARHGFLRASNYYRNSEFFLRNNEPKRIEAYKKSVSSFEKAMDLFDDVAVKHLHIPFEDMYLSAYLYERSEEAPTLIFIGGYDSTVEELYFSGGAAAYERGFNVLLFDGPGQGEALRIQKKCARYDFEKPVRAAIDYLEEHTDINTHRFMGLMGMSLGGYYAARAAAFESRIDACILFDVFIDVWDSIVEQNPMLKQIEGPNAKKLLAKIDPAKLDGNTRWLIQNALWVFGLDNVLQIPQVVKKFSLYGVADKIKCPMLLLAGTQDHFAALTQIDYLKENLKTSYTTHIFDETFGAEQHCQEGNQSRARQVIFDWLEDQVCEKEK
jgi:pimeloyl-ACP methyl ester carboxylesterase